MTVEELLPGDLVEGVAGGGVSAVYIAQAEHPIWPTLRLVIWKMADDSWSHDALLPQQDVGNVRLATLGERTARLRDALVPGTVDSSA